MYVYTAGTMTQQKKKKQFFISPVHTYSLLLRKHWAHNRDLPDDNTLVLIFYQHVTVHVISEGPNVRRILVRSLRNVDR